jgi:tryptophan synthase beta chain
VPGGPVGGWRSAREAARDGRLLVKICGLTSPEDAQLAVEAGADAVGFVFWFMSPRRVAPDRAAAIARELPRSVLRVGVFVDTARDEMARVADTVGLDLLQLHGDEPPDALAGLPRPALKAVRVGKGFAQEEAIRYAERAAGLVVDTRLPGETQLPGGTGERSGAEGAVPHAGGRPRPRQRGGGDPRRPAPRGGRVERRRGPARTEGSREGPRLRRGGPGRGERAGSGAGQGSDTFECEERGSMSTEAAKRPRHAAAWPDPAGHFGPYGGRYVPETLMEPLRELEAAWAEARRDPAFDDAYGRLLRDYVGRPTPLGHAKRLSDRLGCRVWLKREDLCHTGAHKINNALGQALLVKRMRKRRVVAETGAGQHGVATATVCALLGLECVVYMGTDDMVRQAPNVARMRLLGAEVRGVSSGTRTLKDAINEAMRDWVTNVRTTHYLLGSVLGAHPYPAMVRDFQRVIGEEARAQLLAADGRLPDLLVACVGGGSNAIGLFFAFLEDAGVRMVGVEAGGRSPRPGDHAARFLGVRAHAGPVSDPRTPSLSLAGADASGPVPVGPTGAGVGVLQGTRTYLLQDAAGNVLPTHSVSAGLDYPAVGPEHALLHDEGRVEYAAVSDEEALAAFHLLGETEGILPALESAHAVAWLVREAPTLTGRTVIINLSGRGDKDLGIVESVGSDPRKVRTEGGRDT